MASLHKQPSIKPLQKLPTNFSLESQLSGMSASLFVGRVPGKYFSLTLHYQMYVDTCSSFQKSWALIWSWSPPAITASSLLERFPWNITSGGDLLPFSDNSIVRSGTDVGRLGLARSWRSNSSQRCLMGLRSGLCAG